MAKGSGQRSLLDQSWARHTLAASGLGSGLEFEVGFPTLALPSEQQQYVAGRHHGFVAGKGGGADADESPPGVQQRATRVAAVDLRVRLHARLDIEGGALDIGDLKHRSTDTHVKACWGRRDMRWRTCVRSYGGDREGAGAQTQCCN